MSQCGKQGMKNKIIQICNDFNNNPSELISVLHKLQSYYGFLSKELQDIVAEELKIPSGKVFGVVSFYSYFTMEPKGKFPISICMGTACYVKGAEKVLAEFENKLKIMNGETSKDGKFSISTLRCVGACGLAPVVMIGEKVYGNVKVEEVSKILSEYE